MQVQSMTSTTQQQQTVPAPGSPFEEVNSTFPQDCSETGIMFLDSSSIMVMLMLL